nr:MAG TPA: hypothetical protein [Microviridae sp.]
MIRAARGEQGERSLRSKPSDASMSREKDEM